MRPHEPRLAVLACADARPDPARALSAEEGELFAVRNAGNVLCEHALESLTFAAEIGAGTIVVLGHTDCGAIKDALSSAPALPATARLIRPHIEGFKDPTEAARAHAKKTAEALRAALGGKAEVKAALFHTERGEVEWI